MLRSILNTYRESFAGLPRNVWILAFVLFINRMGAMVLPFLALYANRELGFSYEETGSLVAIYGIGSIAGSFLGGKLCTRFGSTQIQTASLLLTAGGFLLLLVPTTFAGMSGCLILLSIVAEALRPASTTATTEESPPELHARALALNRLAVNLGMSVGPVLGGFIALHDYRLLFYVDASTCVAAAIFLLLLFRNPKAQTREERAVHPKKHSSPIRDFQFLIMLFLIGLNALVFFQMMVTFPLYLGDYYGLDESKYGMLFAINTTLIVLFEMVLIHKAEGWNLLRTIGWGSLFSCLGFGILPFGSSFAFGAVAMVIITVGEMLAMPLSAAYVASRSSAHNRGVYMGLFAATYSCAMVIGPAVGTQIYAIDPNYVWYTSLGFAVVTWAGFYALAAFEKRKGHSPTA